MISATYRQSSRPNEAGLTRDAKNRWLWRMTPRRLEAEAIRDAMLAVAGRSTRGWGDPGITSGSRNELCRCAYEPKTTLGPDEFRRMVYQFKPRSQQDPTFGAFDCPDGGLVAPRRNVSTTALQALNLLNSAFIIDKSAAFAARLVREAGTEPSDQAAAVFSWPSAAHRPTVSRWPPPP